MADPRIRIIVDAVTDAAERGLRRLEGVVEGTAKTAEKSAGGFKKLQGSFTELNQAAELAKKVIAGFEKAFDTLREGAVVAQTTESFDRLIASLGVAPAVLDDLRAAARGTVDDMTIMSGTLALVAGVSDDLASAMVGASPQLMEIAKAANKLNPTLGTTAHMYDSIAIGIKRSQPLILDNLGLTIKVGDANAAYAEKLGKTVEALTAEEKQMALLEATLEAGDRMIQQVGGSTESATDAFDQLTTSIKNATDSLKQDLAQGILNVGPAVSNVVNLITALETVMQENQETAIEGAQSYKEYALALVDAALASGQIMGREADALRRYIEGTQDAGWRTKELAGEIGLMSEAAYDSYQAFEKATGGMENFTHAQDAWVEQAEEAAAKLDASLGPSEARFIGWGKAVEGGVEVTQELKEAWAGYNDVLGHNIVLEEAVKDKFSTVIPVIDEAAEAEKRAAEAAEAAAEAQERMNRSLDVLHQAIEGAFGDSIDQFREDIGELKGALENGEISVGQFKDSLAGLAAAFEENTKQMMFNIAEAQIMDALQRGLIEDVNNSGTAYDEATGSLWTMAERMGIVDEATLALIRETQQMTNDFIAGKSSAYELGDGLSHTASQAAEAAAQGRDVASVIRDEMPDKKNISIYHNLDETSQAAWDAANAINAIHSKTVTITTKYLTTGTPPGHESGPYAMQHGGPVRAGSQYLVGEAGPELFVPQMNGYVVPNHQITNENYNLSIHTNAPSESALSDFHTMKALAGV